MSEFKKKIRRIRYGILDKKIKKRETREAENALKLRNMEATGVMRSYAEEKKDKKFGFDYEYFFRSLTQVFAALLAVGATVYFGWHLVNQFTETVKTANVFSLTETEWASGTAYIIRDEQPVKSSMSGIFDYSVSEGGRVANGEKICTVYSNFNENSKDRIIKLDGEIAALKKSLGAETVVTGITKAMSNAETDYLSFMGSLASGNHSVALAESETFRTDLGRLLYLSGKGDDMLKKLQELKDGRASALSSLGTSVGSVYAPKAGYLFYSCDGYESAFDMKLVKSFSSEALSAAVGSTPKSTDGTVGKLVLSQIWYAAVVTEDFDLAEKSVGETLSVEFSDNFGITVEMTIINKIRTDSGFLFLLSSENMPEGFDYTRSQDVKIVNSVYDGYRIPVSAVHTWEGMTGVYTLHGGYVYFRKINVIFEGEGYYIVSSYGDVEKGAPKTYKVIAYGDRGIIDDYARMHKTAKALGLSYKNHDNGGIKVKYGETYKYYYFLNSLEEIIVSGSNLYHGKVLN